MSVYQSAKDAYLDFRGSSISLVGKSPKKISQFYFKCLIFCAECENLEKSDSLADNAESVLLKKNIPESD